VNCRLFDAATIEKYHNEALDYKYAEASVDHASDHDSTRLEDYPRSGRYGYAFCDVGLFSTFISRLRNLQELDLPSGFLCEVSSKTRSRVLNAIWELHAVNIRHLSLVVEPYLRVDLLVEVATRLLSLHSLSSASHFPRED
jgi:hypothetical protein